MSSEEPANKGVSPNLPSQDLQSDVANLNKSTFVGRLLGTPRNSKKAGGSHLETNSNPGGSGVLAVSGLNNGNCFQPVNLVFKRERA